MLGWLRKYLYNKLLIRLPNIILLFIWLSVFYVCKDIILNTYLRFSMRPYKQEHMRLKNMDIEKIALIKENEYLRHIMSLPEKLNKKIVFGKVLTNIYATSSFWVLFQNTKDIKKGMAVWFQSPFITSLGQTIFKKNEKLSDGIRLIGFVEEVKKNHVKVNPISHSKSRFHANTISEDGLLLIGNNGKLDILLSNSSKLTQNELVVFENSLEVGVIRGKNIKFRDFSNIKWVGISV